MLAPEDSAAWTSQPWERITDKTSGTTVGWHMNHIPYLPTNTSLQTLHVWLPSSSETPPSFPRAPDRQSAGTWLIFLHGGAWRDPDVDASAFSATASRLLKRAPSIAGLASLNYRLSPHPSHSSTPEREHHHPAHIADVLAGIGFLQRAGAAMQSWVLAGHSCGATLAFQAVADPERWGLHPTLALRKMPTVLVGSNGLYDLAGFIDKPPPSHAPLRRAYTDFTRGAFGNDPATWREVCPASAPGLARWMAHWAGRLSAKGVVVLVQSRHDTLVPYNQLQGLRKRLEEVARGVVVVRVREGSGDHDCLWKTGDQLAEILAEAFEWTEREQRVFF